MNGADVKGIADERVRTICNSNDGVCKGEFNITAGHLTYAGDSAGFSAAVAFAESMLKKPS
jgi:hypothetical protein